MCVCEYATRTHRDYDKYCTERQRSWKRYILHGHRTKPSLHWMEIIIWQRLRSTKILFTGTLRQNKKQKQRNSETFSGYLKENKGSPDAAIQVSPLPSHPHPTNGQRVGLLLIVRPLLVLRSYLMLVLVIPWKDLEIQTPRFFRLKMHASPPPWRYVLTSHPLSSHPPP